MTDILEGNEEYLDMMVEVKTVDLNDLPNMKWIIQGTDSTQYGRIIEEQVTATTFGTLRHMLVLELSREGMLELDTRYMRFEIPTRRALHIPHDLYPPKPKKELPDDRQLLVITHD
jgi:hypothetical protein